MGRYTFCKQQRDLRCSSVTVLVREQRRLGVPLISVEGCRKLHAMRAEIEAICKAAAKNVTGPGEGESKNRAENLPLKWIAVLTASSSALTGPSKAPHLTELANWTRRANVQCSRSSGKETDPNEQERQEKLSKESPSAP